MKYLLNTFIDESEATKYPNTVSVLYCVNRSLVIGCTYKKTIPFMLLKQRIKNAKIFLGENIEAIIKVCN